jgi:hypothetical protein
MWMMTTLGFFSVVEKPKGKICIRARSMHDMIQFQQNICDGDIVVTPKADYTYRMIVPRKQFNDAFPRFAKYLTYDNFKDAVGKTNSRRAGLYHNVWATLRNIAIEELADEES